MRARQEEKKVLRCGTPMIAAQAYGAEGTEAEVFEEPYAGAPSYAEREAAPQKGGLFSRVENLIRRPEAVLPSKDRER